jgi:hypothetical protein
MMRICCKFINASQRPGAWAISAIAAAASNNQDEDESFAGVRLAEKCFLRGADSAKNVRILSGTRYRRNRGQLIEPGEMLLESNWKGGA